MEAIPPPKNPPASRPRSAKPRGRSIVGPLLTVALLAGAGFAGWKYRAEIAALMRPASGLPKGAFVLGAAPLDTTPLALPTEGWSWLFEDAEWRVPTDEHHEFNGGVLRLRTGMEKTQPAADGAIRARLIVREEMKGASLMLRGTEEGRYRLILDPDLRTIRLVHEAADKTRELGQYRLTKFLAPGDRLTLELRANADRLTASVNDASVIEVEDTAIKGAGKWGVESKDAWFELVEVPTIKEMPKVAEAKPAEPEPATPPPATPPPLSETAKWLAGVDPQWQTAYQRDVMGPFEKGVADLKKQYAAAIDAQLAAIPAARVDDATLLRAEKERVTAGQPMPETDEPTATPALKQLRSSYRAQFARLDRVRFDQAKALHTKYDALLAQSEAALTQRQRTAEAGELKAHRDKLSAGWLKPPVVVAVAAAPVRPTPGATPAPVAKMTPRQTIEKLLAMGAGVWIRNDRGRMSPEIEKIDEIDEREKFTIVHVELRPQRADDTPITTADLAILAQLPDVTNLGLHGPAVTAEIVEKLRGNRQIQTLTLDRAKITAETYAVLPTLTELRSLDLRNLGSSDAAMKVVAECRKVQRLALSNLPVSDEGLASLGKLGTLEDLQLSGLDKITSAGVNNLTAVRGLKRLGLSDVSVSTPVLEAVAKFNGLEYLTLSGNALKDDQVAPLATMGRLRSLDLNNTGVTGSVFEKWPVRTSMETLNLQGEAGISDAALKALTSAFPRLESLSFTAAPLSATPAA